MAQGAEPRARALLESLPRTNPLLMRDEIKRKFRREEEGVEDRLPDEIC